MKRIFTLLLAGMLCLAANAQLLLNEIYTDPGSGKHEFFELYNPSLLPETTDNYTLVTFYKTNTSKGFYVLDMPAATVPGKGHFVGAAADPFNYQGVNGTTNTSFSWNSNTELNSNGGRLTKWEFNKGTDQDPADNNPSYDFSKTVALNDLFTRLNGTGGSFVVFLYKNGQMVNSALLGTGGNSGLSAEVLAMPPLFVDMQGSSPDFTIDFSGYGNLPVENVGQEAGSDNGYIREYDGACGAWTKSSAQVNHTPLVSNGQKAMFSSGLVGITANITVGNEANGSILTYQVTSAGASLYPMEVGIYVDNGTYLNQFDSNDAILRRDTLTSGGTPYNLPFKPYNNSIILVVKTSAGCVDHQQLVSSMLMMTLPVKLVNFTADARDNKAVLNWSVANNEEGKYFELQNSVDGHFFSTITTKENTGKQGSEIYSYKDSRELAAQIYYRLKMVNKNNSVAFSNVVKLAGSGSASSINLLQNPVTDHLRYSYQADADAKATVNIYSMLGVSVYTKEVQVKKGTSSHTIDMASRLQSGTYLLEIRNGNERIKTKFIKY